MLWNVPDTECQSVVEFFQPYEIKRYANVLVQDERESMTYTYVEFRFVAVNLYPNQLNFYLCEMFYCIAFLFQWTLCIGSFPLFLFVLNL